MARSWRPQGRRCGSYGATWTAWWGREGGREGGQLSMGEASRVELLASVQLRLGQQGCGHGRKQAY